MATSFNLDTPSPEAQRFLDERHLATLTTVSKHGSLQVTPVGFTYEPERRLARVITWSASQKATNISFNPGGAVALCQFDGGRWLTLNGTATVSLDQIAITEAVRRYAQRYREPSDRDDRIVIEIIVSKIIGRA